MNATPGRGWVVSDCPTARDRQKFVAAVRRRQERRRLAGLKSAFRVPRALAVRFPSRSAVDFCLLLFAVDHRPRALEHGVGSGTDAIVFGKVAPDDRAVAIDEELGGARNCLARYARSLVDEVVAADHVRRRIREERKGVADFACELEGRCGIIDTDRDRLDTQPLELGETALDTP